MRFNKNTTKALMRSQMKRGEKKIERKVEYKVFDKGAKRKGENEIL